MGSSTREASVAARAALPSLSGTAALATGEELLAAGRVVGDSMPLRSALADPSLADADKSKIVKSLFGSSSAATRAVLDSVATSRWSDHDDMLAGIEELGVSAIARSAEADVDIIAELNVFRAAVTSDPELELAVGSKLGAEEAKVALVERLLKGKASAQTLTIVRHLVQQPRGRRIRALISDAANIIARESELSLATVTVARELSDAQLSRLAVGLESRYGSLRITQVVDPSIIGGLRVQVGDEVIDDSVATKISSLKLQLAG